MMGRGADGGRVADGNPFPIQNTKNCPKITSPKDSLAVNSTSGRTGMDIFAQALKAFAVKPPFDADDGGAMASDGGGALQFVSGGGDGRRKHRKVQGRGHEPYSASTFGAPKKIRDGKTSKIWLETEEYFREVTSEDIEALIAHAKINFSDGTLVSDPCLLIPRIRGPRKDKTNALQNLNYAALGTMFKKEDVDASQDIKDPALAQPINERVFKTPELASNKQKTHNELRILIEEEPSEHGSGSVSVKQEPTSSSKLTDILPPMQESASDMHLSAAVPSPMDLFQSNHAEKTNSKLEMNFSARRADPVSVPVHKMHPYTKSEVVRDLNQDLCSSTKLSIPEQQPSLDAKPTSILSSHKQKSRSGTKFAVIQELNSLPSSVQEQSSGIKRRLHAANLYSKKRKLSVSSAEMISTVVSPPENGNEELCHVCYGGDSEEWNKILFCDVCDATVHQECYGVHKIPNCQWLCSWCSYWSQARSMHKNYVRPENGSFTHKQSNGDVDHDIHPCILCPRRSGALKPVTRPSSDRDNNGYVEFAHLFCCQWFPETYIENTETMEPIKNVEGIKDTLWKLLCSLCKEKHGACIQCSHGNCDTAFHPLCAREMKLWMGISSKEGSGDIDLWAFCSKHSLPQADRASLTRNGSLVGLSEAEFMPSGQNNTSHCSNKICLGQGNQSPPIASRCQSMHAQKFLKDVSCKSIKDKGGLSENLQGIENKISDMVSAVRPSNSVTELVLGNSDNISAENRGEYKRSPILQDVRTTAECRAAFEVGGQDVSASIYASESKENALNVEADSIDCIENLRKVVQKRHEFLADLENKMGGSSNMLTSFIEDNALVARTSDRDDLAGDSEQSGRLNKRTKNKKKLLKATCCNGESTLAEAESSSQKDGVENDVGLVEDCLRPNKFHDNESRTDLQKKKDHDQIKTLGKDDDADSADEVRGMQPKNSGNLLLENCDEMSQNETKQQARSETTKLDCCSASLASEMEDVPDGIGDSAVEKNSNSKHAPLKIQAKVFDCKELAQSMNNKAISSNILLKGCPVGAELDALIEGNNAGLIFEGDRAENSCIDVPTNADIECVKRSPDYYLHPYIQGRLLEFQHGLGLGKGDQRMNHVDQPESKAAAKKSCSHGTENTEQEMDHTSSMSNIASISKNSQRKPVIEARTRGVSNLAPEDELESEILFLQSSLLEHAWINRKRSEDLLFRVITNLSKDQQAVRKQKSDKVLVNEYLCQEREAKKQGRKERRHKEAQAILAAATAAAAASPRIGSFRKDGSGDAVEEHGLRQFSFLSRPLQPDEWGTGPSFPMAQPMKVSQQKYLKGNIGAGRPGSSSQTMLRAKETLSRPIVAKVSSEKRFDTCHEPAGSLQDDSLLCDICRLQESTHANKIYICRRCKVAVHQDCYGLSTVHSSGWYCQPCEDLHWKYQGTRIPSVVSRGRPGYDFECALCGGLSGAFKRTTKGQWVHVFCAEWILENTFRKGQIEPIAGLELLYRERPIAVCSICHRQQGVCLKCNFGHCHTSFHPLCARDSGFYMSVVTHGGRVQHKAYCEKHSSEQKLKVESRKYGGAEELKIIKQMRVELERLRLICERTVRREKLKREVLHCSHNILASKRDCVAFSAVFHSSFLPPNICSHADIAQGSIVTSFRGLTDESKAWKDNKTAKHRLDGYAIGTGSGQVRDVFPGQSTLNHPMIISDDVFCGRNSGDSSASVGKSGLSRKPLTYSADSGASDDREDAQRRPKKPRKIAETLQREMVMTPTEASMQNRRLPKGYAYVPLLDLQNVGPQDS